LAKDFSVRASALRYYEACGLIQSRGRNELGARVFGDDARRALAAIKQLQGLGFTLNEIRKILASGSKRELERAIGLKMREVRGELKLQRERAVKLARLRKSPADFFRPRSGN
jgi:DNA-binding transcriptional MerR regulator